MKKFILTDSGEEIKYGERLTLSMSHNIAGVTFHEDIGCTFLPPIVPLLLEEGIIKEVETKESLEDRVNDLTDRITYLEGIIADGKGAK